MLMICYYGLWKDFGDVSRINLPDIFKENYINPVFLLSAFALQFKVSIGVFLNIIDRSNTNYLRLKFDSVVIDSIVIETWWILNKQTKAKIQYLHHTNFVDFSTRAPFIIMYYSGNCNYIVPVSQIAPLSP